MTVRISIEEDSLTFRQDIRLANPFEFAYKKYFIVSNKNNKALSYKLQPRKGFYISPKALKSSRKHFNASPHTNVLVTDQNAPIICLGYSGRPVRYCNWKTARDKWIESPIASFNYIYSCYRNLDVESAFSDYRFYSYKKQDVLWRKLCDTFKMRINNNARKAWISNWGDVCNSIFNHFYQKVIIEKHMTDAMSEALSRNDILFLFLLFIDREVRHATRHLIYYYRSDNNQIHHKLIQSISDFNNEELFETYSIEDEIEKLEQVEEEFYSSLTWRREKLKAIQYK